MGAESETHIQTLGEERAQIGDLHQILPLGAHGTLWKRERKNYRSQRDVGHKENKFQRHQLGRLIGAHRGKTDNHRTYMGLC